MDFQHKLAVIIAQKLDNKASQADTNHILLIYGIEVFLNEFLKLAISLLIAIPIGLFPEAVFATVYLLLLRKYAGGRHFESNLACSLFSFFVIVVLPGIGKYIFLSYNVRCLLIAGTALLLVCVVPFLKEEEQMTYNEKLRRKIITLLIYCIGLGISFFLGGVPLLQGASFVGAIVAVSAIPHYKKPA